MKYPLQLLLIKHDFFCDESIYMSSTVKSFSPLTSSSKDYLYKNISNFKIVKQF